MFCEENKKVNIEKFNSIARLMPLNIKKVICDLPNDTKSHTLEIRIKSDRCINLITENDIYFLNKDGTISENFDFFKSLKLSFAELNDFFWRLCSYSIYSFQNQIKNGYITISGGNRVGICGEIVYEKGEISNIKNITSLNFRIAKEIKDCSEKIYEKIKYDCAGVLIVGAPCTGKTTILRDLARIFSTQNPMKKVVIIDEKHEISAFNAGKIEFDIGFSDVLAGVSKHEGAMMAVKHLSPDIIICDEIGNKRDCEYITECLNSGVRFIASMHANSLEEFKLRPQSKFIFESRAFEYIVLLNKSSKMGEVKSIYKLSEIL